MDKKYFCFTLIKIKSTILLYKCKVDFLQNNYTCKINFYYICNVENIEIKDRILQMLKEENLTYTKFAEKLDVQPSSISHIVSGRNKPSLEFLQKVLKNFTNINPLWLIIGKGDMFVQKANVQTKINFDAAEEHKNNSPSLLPDTDNSQAVKDKEEITANQERKIKKIIVFYNDDTFEEYTKE